MNRRPAEEAALLPASEFLQPHRGVAALREALGRRAAKLPERIAADLERFGGATATRPLHVGNAAATSRALQTGDAAEIWAPLLAPASGLDHVSMTP